MKAMILPVATGIGLTLMLTGCETNPTQAPVFTPPDSLPMATTKERVSFVLTARGVQIYGCEARTNEPGKFEWKSKGADADLFDRSGKRVGHHYKGPTWEATDGSLIAGLVTEQSAPKNTNAIPWLTISVTNRLGSGLFGSVTSVQRVDTVGGVAPPGGCAAVDTGKELRVPYTATYVFYVSRK